MPVLIDGNNLLYAAYDADPERLPGRSALCRTLGDWARRRRRKVHVVFDGAEPSPERVRQIGDPGISIAFSGRGVSADAVLIELIQSDSAARRLLVVTSDRAIARIAKRRRSKVVRSATFWERVLATLAKPAPQKREIPGKLHGLSPESTDEWLREMGLD